MIMEGCHHHRFRAYGMDTGHIGMTTKVEVHADSLESGDLVLRCSFALGNLETPEKSHTSFETEILCQRGKYFPLTADRVGPGIQVYQGLSLSSLWPHTAWMVTRNPKGEKVIAYLNFPTMCGRLMYDKTYE